MIEFQENVDLSDYNTFWVKAKAKLFVEISNEEQFLELLGQKERKENERLFLGTGANTLFTRDFKGLIVKVNIKGKKIIEETEDWVIVEAGAGENWNDFVLWTLDQWLAGLENMVAIPSSVWAAAFGNIGAYGSEAKDRIVSVEGINTGTKKHEERNNAQCEFEYRGSVFKKQLKEEFLITKVRYLLKKFDQNYVLNTNYKDIQDYIKQNPGEMPAKKLAEIISEIRWKKLPNPTEIWTAGSFFKNPVIDVWHFSRLQTRFLNLISFDIPDEMAYVKLSAGQLIELAGMKWYRIGDAWVYDKHALVLVNHGNASGREIAELADKIQDRVQEIFDITIYPEVIYV